MDIILTSTQLPVRLCRLMMCFIQVTGLLIATGAIAWQYLNWSQLKADCPNVKQTREALVPPVDIRWGDLDGGIRMGTVSGTLNVGALDGLPLFFENDSSSFQVLKCWMNCRFHSYNHQEGIHRIFWCHPQLLNSGLSHVERFGVWPTEFVVFPPHSVSLLRFDGFGEQMSWGRSGGDPIGPLGRRIIESNVSDGRITLWPSGAPHESRLILWQYAYPDDDSDS